VECRPLWDPLRPSGPGPHGMRNCAVLCLCAVARFSAAYCYVTAVTGNKSYRISTIAAARPTSATCRLSSTRLWSEKGRRTLSGLQ